MKKYRDFYFEKAKQENYPARSVYKLKELSNHHGLLKPGYKVLDLGASPGSWTMYASERVGPTGLVIGADLQAAGADFADNVIFLDEDVLSPSLKFLALLAEKGPFDAILSDMAPKTCGIKFVDQVKSLELVSQALALALPRLVRGGNFVAKVFLGPDVKELMDSMRPLFEKVKTEKPQSSRSESKETFILGLGYNAKK